MNHLFRTPVSLLVLALLALAGCQQAVTTADDDAPPDIAYAMRWWNVLNGDQMVAALYGSTATAEQAAAAKKPYSMLDDETKGKVNAAAKRIRGDKTFFTVGAWWESLNCELMRVAAGDGNTHDPSSAYCRHYPGSDFPAAKILGDAEKKFVDKIGMALLGWNDPGVYPPDYDYAMRWWNVLNADQMVAALYGDEATADEAEYAKKMYADLDPITKGRVNRAAMAIGGADTHDSVGAWWESLDCQLMRIAAGDGNTHDPSSAYCAHYPGSDHAKILSDDALAHVNRVGMALLGRDDPGTYPPASS
jgi:hypothetical protein